MKASKLLTEIGDTDRVMQDPVGAVVVRIRPTDNADDRQILTVGSSDTVDNTETSDGESDHNCTDAFPSGVPIGSISCVDLVAATNIIDARLIQEVIEQDEVEVSRHSEDIVASDFDKPASEMPAQASSGFDDRVYRRPAVQRVRHGDSLGTSAACCNGARSRGL